MGEDREVRKEIKLAVRIFGTDADGRVFSENVFTSNISRSGVELSGVQARLKVDEIIGLAYGTNKGRFRVRWAGRPDTPEAGNLGLLNMAPDKQLWDIATPKGIERGSANAERRAEPRLKCQCSIEIHPDIQSAPIRSHTGDLSMGGCFVEMSLPIAKGTKAKVGIWLDDTKIWAWARVVSCTPGFGIGIRFLEMSPSDQHKLSDFLQAKSRTRI